MDQKREELIGGEVEMRQARLGLSVELLGHEPEGIRFFEALTLAMLRDPVQMPWGVARELDIGSEGKQVAQQVVKEQVTGAVGERANPLAHGGVSGAILGQHAQQAPPTEADEQVEGGHLLQESDDETAVGMEKVRQQGVGTAARFAADALDGQPIVNLPGDGRARVSAPPDQGTAVLAVGMRTTLRYGERTALDENCDDVFFDGTEEWLYNDHELGTPPLVVRRPSIEPRREVSSFLLKVPAIIPIAAGSVKPERSPGPCQPLLERSIIVTRCLVSSRHPSRPIIYSGPKRLYSDHLMRPVTPGFPDPFDRHDPKKPNYAKTNAEHIRNSLRGIQRNLGKQDLRTYLQDVLTKDQHASLTRDLDYLVTDLQSQDWFYQQIGPELSSDILGLLEKMGYLVVP